MLDQRFTIKNFSRLVTATDFRRDPSIGDFKALLPILAKLETDVTNRTLTIDAFKTTQKKGSKVYVSPDLYADFAIRKLNDNLKRIFRVSQSNRDSLVTVVITLLSEQTPFHVIKSDISKFFESTNVSHLADTVGSHGLISFDSKYVFRQIIEGTNLNDCVGLPRGLSLSSTLSEKGMQAFDSSVKRIPGVYYYGRFVDDLIVFCYKEPTIVLQQIRRLLPSEYCLNETKTKLMAWRTSPPTYETVDFDFLGYRFSKLDNKLQISIAEKKVKRLKSRIIKSLLAFVSDSDFFLLEDRIKFLASNFSLTTHKSEKPIKSGIFYSYSKAINSTNTLIELDRFFRAQIESPTSISVRKGLTLSAYQRRKLRLLCFRRGYERRIVHKFTEKRISEIKACWEYA